MNILKLILTFLLMVMTFLTCSNPTEPIKQNEHPVTQNTVIPNFIIAKSDSSIISSVGSTFFTDYIRYDSVRSRYFPVDTFCINHPSNCFNFMRYPYYSMVYTLRIPEKPWIDETIEFIVDSVGNIITEYPPYGIPECSSDSSCCIFGIDSTMAVNIAKQAGLEEGIKPWLANFYWYGDSINMYVWGVANYLTESGGKVVILDSNSGIVLKISNWIMAVE